MFVCFYDEKQHEIFNSEVARWARRNAPAGWKDRLFTYHHQITENFVVAVWAKEPYGIISDIINLGKSMGNFNKPRANELMRRMWKPNDPVEMAQQINQQARNFDSRQQDKQGEKAER